MHVAQAEELAGQKLKMNLFLRLQTRLNIYNTEMENLEIGYGNCEPFSQLYIANQRRDGDMDNFFSYENTTVPPSLSKDGMLRSGDKPDLLHCIAEYGKSVLKKPSKELYLAILIDQQDKSISQIMLSSVFYPHLQSELEGIQRLDVVWDVHVPNSLKMTTRQHRGDGTQRHVGDKSLLPAKWNKFLRVNENKPLFHYIATAIQSNMFAGAGTKQIVTTYADKVLASNDVVPEDMSPCNHEEGDYRSVLHSYHMSKSGLSKVMISTADTDTVVIAVSSFNSMMQEELEMD